jgi:hypothetical protein
MKTTTMKGAPRSRVVECVTWKELVDLLTNAVESIQVGVEDYQAGTPSRLLSAVRNIHAGILLLYKEALRRESPADTNDVLMMAKIIPIRDARGIVFVGDGRKTADVQQIRERFDGVGIVTDWKRFERINDARNDVEHRYPTVDQKALQGLISDSFILVRNFITDELHDDPLVLLGEDTWQAMLEVAEVYKKEKEGCQQLMAKIDWVSPALKEGLEDLTCSSCGSELLRPTLLRESYSDVTLECTSCGNTEDAQEYIPRAIASALGGSAYIAAKEGGETPYVSCPECGEKAYVIDERRCTYCEHEADHTCARCGTEIPAEELDSEPYCGYCEHMMNKDD